MRSTGSPSRAAAARSSSRPATSAWTRGRRRSTVRTVNALATSRRSRVWSGGSRPSRDRWSGSRRRIVRGRVGGTDDVALVDAGAGLAEEGEAVLVVGQHERSEGRPMDPPLVADGGVEGIRVLGEARSERVEALDPRRQVFASGLQMQGLVREARATLGGPMAASPPPPARAPRTPPRPAPCPARPPPTWPCSGVAVVAVSTSAPLVRVADAPTLAIAFWRNALALPVLALMVAVAARRAPVRLDPAERRLVRRRRPVPRRPLRHLGAQPLVTRRSPRRWRWWPPSRCGPR